MKIIIADDSSFIRSMITKAVKSNIENIEVISCTDGKQAYDAYCLQEPDFLITDLLMPEMTGQQLLSKLKSENYLTKAIVISADIQTATRKELDEIGIIDFINKPLTADKLSLLVDLIRGKKNVE
jgi:two-component system, chemotaxis family, chemotaxis protein CheY